MAGALDIHLQSTNNFAWTLQPLQPYAKTAEVLAGLATSLSGTPLDIWKWNAPERRLHQTTACFVLAIRTLVGNHHGGPCAKGA